MLLVKTRIDPSAIHGIGLFTNEFIAKGTTIWEFTPGFDVYLKAEDIQRLPAAAQAQMSRYCYRDRETGQYVLCADDARFFNHSDHPNSVDLPGPEGRTVAIPDIRIGEELTCDYQMFDADFREKLRSDSPSEPEKGVARGAPAGKTGACPGSIRTSRRRRRPAIWWVACWGSTRG